MRGSAEPFDTFAAFAPPPPVHRERRAWISLQNQPSAWPAPGHKPAESHSHSHNHKTGRRRRGKTRAGGIDNSHIRRTAYRCRRVEFRHRRRCGCLAQQRPRRCGRWQSERPGARNRRPAARPQIARRDAAAGKGFLGITVGPGFSERGHQRRPAAPGRRYRRQDKPPERQTRSTSKTCRVTDQMGFPQAYRSVMPGLPQFAHRTSLLARRSP